MRCAPSHLAHVAAALLLPLLPALSFATTIEQIVGGIDAVVIACGPVDPKSAKTGAELLERERVQRKLDLNAIRSTESYKSLYNAEVNRLLALPTKARIQACQSIW
jgi:hypothetical protein